MGQLMRVVSVLEEGKLGGPQIYIILLASTLRTRVAMTLIFPEDNSSEICSMCEAEEICCERLKISRITKEWQVALRYLLFFPFEIRKLVAVLKKIDCDAVYACGGAWQYKGAIAGWLAGKKIIWQLNDTSMPWVFRKIFGYVSRLADGFIYASARSKIYYEPLVDAKKLAYIIPSPVDTGRFDPTLNYPGDEDLIERWDKKIIIGTVANISPVKGLDVLIRAAAELKARGVDARFVVVGAIHQSQQHYFLYLQKLASDLFLNNIEFVKARADVRPLLKWFDIYVCSSQAESSPISVWEAMAMAKPVISTDVGDVPIYVKDEQSGFVVDVGDSAAIADRVVRLIGNRSLRQEFGRKAREIAVRELDVTRCADRHFSAFQEILLRQSLGYE